MAKHRFPIPMDVVEAARRRIRHTLDTFDTVAVMFSGGKDSLVVLHLLRQEWERAGRTDPIKIRFHDEELIPNSVVDFVDEYRRMGWADLYWFTATMEGTTRLPFTTTTFVQWEPGREWVRPKPPWGISGEPGKIYTENRRKKTDGPANTLDGLAYAEMGCKGRTAFLSGIRAVESLQRYKSAMSRVGESWIHSGTIPESRHIQPIYDWNQADIMAWLRRNHIDWCPYYDLLNLTRQPLRVASIFSSRNRHLEIMRRIDPVLMERLLKIFPFTVVKERYLGEIDLTARVMPFAGKGAEGCRGLLESVYGGTPEHGTALRWLREMLRINSRRPLILPYWRIMEAMNAGRIDCAVETLKPHEYGKIDPYVRQLQRTH